MKHRAWAGKLKNPGFNKILLAKKLSMRKVLYAPVAIAKGKVAEAVSADRQANFVDGISGATLTGKYLSGGLKEILMRYEDLSAPFRAGDVELPTLPAGG
jgi:Na+-transporting NADH:ubiquinone oxidoreductase subunit C